MPSPAEPTNHPWAAFIGTLMVGGLAWLIGESLRDWEFHYRIHMAILGSANADLRSESAPWLTRMVFSHPWALYLPAAASAVAMIRIKRKTITSIVHLSFLAAFLTLVIAYLAAYLPVAMPGWWRTGRPEEVIVETKRISDSDRTAGERAAKHLKEEQQKSDPP